MMLFIYRIGWGCYVAEAGIAFFWAFSLTQAVYCWRDDIRFYRSLNFINQAGKPFAIFVATLTMSLLQIESLQKSYTWWNFVLNFFCMSRAAPPPRGPLPPPPPPGPSAYHKYE